MTDGFQRRHRLPGFFMKIILSEVIKKPLLPHGKQGQEIQILRYHLDCRKRDHFCTVPTHRSPVTQVLRQRILGKSVPSALGGPFDIPLFALLSAVQNSLWMR